MPDNSDSGVCKKHCDKDHSEWIGNYRVCRCFLAGRKNRDEDWEKAYLSLSIKKHRLTNDLIETPIKFKDLKEKVLDGDVS